MIYSELCIQAKSIMGMNWGLAVRGGVVWERNRHVFMNMQHVLLLLKYSCSVTWFLFWSHFFFFFQISVLFLSSLQLSGFPLYITE